MGERIIAELMKILQAITIFSPASFSFCGRFIPQPGLPVQQPQGPALPGNQLIAQLQQQLYQYCFIQKFNGYLLEELSIPVEGDNLAQALSQANTSRERWDSGWQIYQTLPSGQIVANKQGIVRAVWPGEFITHAVTGMAPTVGTTISVFAPRESLTMQPGSYFAFGEAVTDQQDDYGVVRFYWNIKADGAASLLRLVTQRLNRFQVPFRLKCPINRAHYMRLDSAVLYVNRRFYRIVTELLVDVHRSMQEYLEPEVPLFTKPLAPGLALAEDPGNGESFGMSRCRMVAEGLWNAYAQGLQTEQARLHEVIKQFERAGIAIEHLYLNAGSVDRYEFPTY